MEEFTSLPDLASRTFGGGIVHANDEFFAAADHLLAPDPPVFSPRTFDHRGQVYDGWETRRRRGEPGHDHVIVRLGAPGVIRGVDVDTSFFTGNYPPHAAVDGLVVTGYPDAAALRAATWTPLVPRSPLSGDSRNLFTVDSPHRFTHVRLSIFPDGGVARLRVHGEVVPDPDLLPAVFDVAAAEHGARITGCSDMFYGHPQNMLMPGLAGCMGDGWETSRRRDDGNDWVLVKLAAPAVIDLADLDTRHFKGNAPGRAGLRGVDARTGSPDDPAGWVTLLPPTPLTADTPHRFPLASTPAVTHVRLDIYPDGGMARLRLHGRPDEAGAAALRARFAEVSRPG
ncbi:allantoicase [Mangrovihabitans endophyticus]|uniref:Probable allantoicase n=1 Tax=Mangrovihabitans endophyticus TaxID=1751298 RepID=A0A8J3FN81_9ACTN|nr:allantoicase [Mangrovihabitans endophyticus]GGK85099.1 putative allantoicase [Mangrovihabitans endophyticus]